MLRTKFYLRFAIAWLCGVVGAIASPLAPCPIPMEKGMQWTYEGKVEWTAANSAVILSTNVHWVMEIVEGLGLTHYFYVHHGTVSSADVQLVSFKKPNTTK